MDQEAHPLTMKLGWAAFGVAVLLALALLVGWRWSINRAEKWAARDMESQQEIARLTQSARGALSQATASNQRAEVAEQGKGALMARLSAAQDNVARRPRPKTLDECQIALRGALFQGDLLAQALELANIEAAARQEALMLTGTALTDTQRALRIQTQRVEAHTKRAKRKRRLGIVTGVAIGLGAGLAGFGIGVAAR